MIGYVVGYLAYFMGDDGTISWRENLLDTPISMYDEKPGQLCLWLPVYERIYFFFFLNGDVMGDDHPWYLALPRHNKNHVCFIMIYQPQLIFGNI